MLERFGSPRIPSRPLDTPGERRRIPETTGIHRRYQEAPGDPRRAQEWPRDPKSPQEIPGAPRDSRRDQEDPRDPRSLQEIEDLIETSFACALAFKVLQCAAETGSPSPRGLLKAIVAA
jgi:hypothetical protein